MANQLAEEQAIAMSRMDLAAREMGISLGKKQSGGGLKMSQLIDIYLKEKNASGDFRPATHQCNSLMLHQACKALDDPYCGDLTRRKIEAYSNALKDPKRNPGRNGNGLSEETVHTYLNRLRCFFSWAVSTGKMMSSPMQDVSIKRARVTKIHDFCTLQQRDALLRTKATTDISTILHLGFFAGLRFMEMLALRWCDVQDDLQAGGDRINLLIRAHDWFIPKGKAARVVPAPMPLRNYLRSIKTGKIHADSKDYVLAPDHEWREDAANGYRYNPKKSFENCVKRSGIGKHVTYHTLRHSYITHHMNAGTSMPLISQWTGDDEQTIRSHYAGYCPDVSTVESIG